ncbi:MAG: iron-sulfur cluster assembly scaffold protein [Desulfobacterales bacterium]|nr:iron-sulfur cluster assembly scaffold protein [Desulfobacterales bacterium]
MEEKQKEFNFWNDHSLEFLEMAMKRDYQESVHKSHGYGKASRECGDTIEFFIMTDKDKLSAVSYDIKGCIYTHACANTIIELVKDKTTAQALDIDSKQIITYLKTLPEKEHHCAVLALKAFKLALSSLDT